MSTLISARLVSNLKALGGYWCGGDVWYTIIYNESTGLTYVQGKDRSNNVVSTSIIKYYHDINDARAAAKELVADPTRCQTGILPNN